MDQEDQRDHAEETANRTAMEQEGREEAAEGARNARILAMWRHADAHAQVALINAADWYVRQWAPGPDDMGATVIAIMVQALHGVSADEAYVIVDAEILAARRRMGR